MSKETTQKKSGLDAALTFIENVCNKLPAPAFIFIFLFALVAVLKDLKLGTLISGLIPIAVILEILWIVFMIIWYLAGIPIGPSTGSALPAGIL